MVLRAISEVIENPAISEIVIVDDASDIEKYNELKLSLENLRDAKIKLYRNESNIDCYRNKKRSVELATKEWCIIFDSDNIISNEYLNKLSLIKWESDTIYAPDFAKPHFDYRHFGGQIIDKTNVHTFIDKPQFLCLINTCNYLVNRRKYLEVWDGSIDPHTADTAYFNSCWIKAGYKIMVVAGMEYEHTVHDGSHYVNNVHKTGNLFEDIIGGLKQLN
jgi:glycosyltransferase involved in cell wall biosynthesis